MGAGLFSMVGSVIHPQRRFQGDPHHIQLPSCTPQFGSIETNQDKYYRKPKNLQHTSRTTFRDDDVHGFLGVKIAYVIYDIIIKIIIIINIYIYIYAYVYIYILYYIYIYYIYMLDIIWPHGQNHHTFFPRTSLGPPGRDGVELRHGFQHEDSDGKNDARLGVQVILASQGLQVEADLFR